MTVPLALPVVGGKFEVPFGYGTLSRASGAWSPDDGQAVRSNVPRIASSRIPICSWKPSVYYTFPPSTAAMDYAAFLARETLFEATFNEYFRKELGLSAGGRSVHGYRLGPTDRKHFIIVGGVHGDEMDGIDGLFKAAEILARGGFDDFLAEWTVFFIPTLNPDGWFAGTKNLTQIGPNGQTVNLDRNWDWYWAEYAEGAAESKGAAAGSSAEATCLLNYLATGNLGGPVPYGAILDFHANDGVGARYQARDRVLRTIGSLPSSAIPYGPLTLDLDTRIWRFVSAAQAARARAGSTERFCRRLRTRFRPSLVGYFASQGAFAMKVSEVKVAASNGHETYASVSNFRLDYVLATAAACTLARWTFKDALLLEPAATNLISNADLRAWTGATGSNPTGLNASRGTLVQAAPYLSHGGHAAKLTAHSAVSLSGGAAEYTSACAAGLGAVIGLGGTKVYRVPANDSTSGLQITLVTHTSPVGAAMVYAGSGVVDILGGGTAPYAGATNLQTRLTTTAGAFAEAAGGGNIGTARMHAGFCDNLLSSPAAASIRGYLAGGVDGAGTRLNTLGSWDPNTTTFAAEAFNLPTAVAGSCAVYFPPTGKIYLFGGESAVTHVNTILAWTPGVSVVSTGVTLPKLLAFAAGAYSPIDQCIYVYGGEDETGTENSSAYKFDPAANTITPITPRQNLADDEALCDVADTGAYWTSPVGRWAGATLAEAANDRGTVVLFGGRLTNSAGALQDKVIVHRPDLGAMGEAQYVFPAFFRYTAGQDTPYTNFLVETFGGTLSNWTDPNSAWAIVGGAVIAQIGLSGPLIVNTSPSYAMHSFTAQVAATGIGAMPDTGLALRATYTGATLLSGYRVRYANDGVNFIWYLDRLVGGVATNLTSLNVTADGSKQIITALRSITFTVEDADPVKLVLVFNGSTIFTYYDTDTARIRTTGQVALFGGST